MASPPYCASRLHRLSLSPTSSAVPACGLPPFTSDAKAVLLVLLGGSSQAVNKLDISETLPTGYQVLLIGKKSQLNYAFNLPRFFVTAGHEGTLSSSASRTRRLV